MTSPDLHEPNGGAQDSGLECPECRYNLTGLTENRCPECGTPFDPRQLWWLTHVQPHLATPWDYGQDIRSFVKTWLLAAFRPTALAKDFPRRHYTDCATGYSLICYLVTAFVFVLSLTWKALGVGVAEAVGVCVVALPVALSASVAFWLCEATIARALAFLVPPTYAKEAYHFWRGLTHYTGGFAILTAACGALTVLGAPLVSVGKVLCAWAGLAVFSWWVGALWHMIWCRSRPGLRRWLACLLVPLIGAATVFASAAVLLTVARSL